MNYDDLQNKLSQYGLDLKKACVDMRNREIGVLKSWQIKQYAEQQGALTATQEALFNAYCIILDMEKA
jgi:hypothetical protein